MSAIATKEKLDCAPGKRRGHRRQGTLDAKVSDKLIQNTKLCKYYLKGRCSKDQKCPFAHKITDLKINPDLFRTRMCIAYTKKGECKEGDHCKYAHGEADLRTAPPSSLESSTTNEPESELSQISGESDANPDTNQDRAEEAEMQMVCTTCGETCEPWANFCPRCGTPTDHAAPKMVVLEHQAIPKLPPGLSDFMYMPADGSYSFFNSEACSMAAAINFEQQEAAKVAADALAAHYEEAAWAAKEVKSCLAVEAVARSPGIWTASGVWEADKEEEHLAAEAGQKAEEKGVALVKALLEEHLAAEAARAAAEAAAQQKAEDIVLSAEQAASIEDEYLVSKKVEAKSLPVEREEPLKGQDSEEQHLATESAETTNEPLFKSMVTTKSMKQKQLVIAGSEGFYVFLPRSFLWFAVVMIWLLIEWSAGSTRSDMVEITCYSVVIAIVGHKLLPAALHCHNP